MESYSNLKKLLEALTCILFISRIVIHRTVINSNCDALNFDTQTNLVVPDHLTNITMSAKMSQDAKKDEFRKYLEKAGR